MWTKKLPDKPGYYWWRRNKYKNEIILYVRRHETFNEDVWLCRRCDILADPTGFTDWVGEWFGPLAAPTGDCYE